ncbi:MAG: hypothetical protein D6769_01435 [Methanobacteriota archaeon]|nr:MAG: hypothetical protein D6769_01435 [Euryarchaeota archaeon]
MGIEDGTIAANKTSKESSTTHNNKRVRAGFGADKNGLGEDISLHTHMSSLKKPLAIRVGACCQQERQRDSRAINIETPHLNLSIAFNDALPKSLFNYVEPTVCIMDKSMNVLYINDQAEKNIERWEEETGKEAPIKKAASIIGKNFFDFVQGKEKSRLKRIRDNVLAGNAVYNIVDVDGSESLQCKSRSHLKTITFYFLVDGYIVMVSINLTQALKKLQEKKPTTYSRLRLRERTAILDRLFYEVHGTPPGSLYAELVSTSTHRQGSDVAVHQILPHLYFSLADFLFSFVEASTALESDGGIDKDKKRGAPIKKIRSEEQGGSINLTLPSITPTSIVATPDITQSAFTMADSIAFIDDTNSVAVKLEESNLTIPYSYASTTEVENEIRSTITLSQLSKGVERKKLLHSSFLAPYYANCTNTTPNYNMAAFPTYIQLSFHSSNNYYTVRETAINKTLEEQFGNNGQDSTIMLAAILGEDREVEEKEGMPAMLRPFTLDVYVRREDVEEESRAD